LGDRRGAYGKSAGKKPLGRPRPIWENIIKIDFQKVRLGGMYLVHLAQNRSRWQAVVNAVMNFVVP